MKHRVVQRIMGARDNKKGGIRAKITAVTGGLD